MIEGNPRRLRPGLNRVSLIATHGMILGIARGRPTIPARIPSSADRVRVAVSRTSREGDVPLFVEIGQAGGAR
jgi:hypothetical protein